MPGRSGINKPKKQLCYDPNRKATDVVGIFFDHINCYMQFVGEYISYYLPEVILAIILLAIMVIAAREFLKQ